MNSDPRKDTAQSLPTPCFPPKLTHMSERFLLSVETEVARFMPVSPWLRTYLLRLAMLLQMSELELVSWTHLLKRALYGEPRQSHIAALQFSAYLSKSLMCRDIKEIDALFATEYPSFREDYEQWLARHPRCLDLKLSDLHFQFKSMWTQGKADASTIRLNSVVDSIISGQAAGDNLYLLPKGHLADFRPNEMPLIGSFISTEASWSQSDLNQPSPH